MPIDAIAINIISNIVYDVAKRVYVVAKSDERGVKSRIEKHIKKNIGNEFYELQDTGGFEQFFKLPQVTDAINSYMIYVYSGNLSEKIAEIKNARKQSWRNVDENDVIKYLLKCFCEFKHGTLVTYNEVEVERFFKCIFNLSNGYFISQLSLESKIGIFQMNRLAGRNLSVLIDIIEKYSQMIEEVLKYPLVEQNSDFDKLREEYMGILRSKHNKAHIYLLDDFNLDKFYIPPILSTNVSERKFNAIIQSDSEYNIWSDDWNHWTDIFCNQNIVYITGGAGYGKSLFMKNIIINHDKLNITESADHIVIYGEIKWFIKEDGGFKSMTEFLSDCITNSTLKKYDDSFINYHLNTGRCVLLLDALDEVPMDKRKDLHQTIIAHLKNLNPNNKVCLTSRDRGFIPVEETIEHYTIEPLDPKQIGQYVERIIKLGKFNQQDKKPFMKQANGLVKKRFLCSFLILSLLINIYKGERELPETKLELYQKCLEYIANKRERPKTDDNFDWRLIAPLMKDNTFIELSLLCFPNNKEVKENEVLAKLTNVYGDMYSDIASLENAISEFLKFCSERTELFVPANVENSFKFFHRSFFEYFFSKHIVIRCIDSHEIYSKLAEQDIDSEIYELTLARLKQETQDRYISLVKHVFDQCELEFKAKEPCFKALNVLILFFQVIDEATFQDKFINLISINSKLIVDNIDKISNQEIILKVILRSDNFDKIEASYKKAAYKEILDQFKSFSIEELKSRVKIVSQKQVINDFYIHVVAESVFPMRRIMNFYSIALLSQYQVITVLKDILSMKMRMSKDVMNKIKELIECYDSLDTNYKRIIDDMFNKDVPQH